MAVKMNFDFENSLKISYKILAFVLTRIAKLIINLESVYIMLCFEWDPWSWLVSCRTNKQNSLSYLLDHELKYV